MRGRLVSSECGDVCANLLGEHGGGIMSIWSMQLNATSKRRACMLIMILCASGCVDIEKIHSGDSCYEATFGTSPPTTISSLHGEGRAFRDSGHAYLKFEVPKKVLMALIGSHFSPITRTEFTDRTSNAGITGPTPTWWTPFAGSPSLFMESNTFHPTFFSGEAFLSYDVTTQVVCFYWDGVD